MMANNLWTLGHLFEKTEWIQNARQQLANVYDGMEMYGSGYSNWAMLLLNNVTPFYEVVLAGKNDEMQKIWLNHYLPNTLTAYSSEEIPLGKFKNASESLIYVCSEENGCLPPFSDLNDVLEIVNLSFENK